MIEQLTFAICDGCGERVPADAMPDSWSTVQQGGRETRLFCSPACHAWGDLGDARPARTLILEARAARLDLTHRDLEVLDGLGRGLSNSEIARALVPPMLESSVKTRLTHIYKAIDVEGRTQAVLVAGHLRLIDLDALGLQIRRMTRDTRGPEYSRFAHRSDRVGS